MSELTVHHKWHEIADLPDDVSQWRDRELEALFEIWTEEKARIGESQSIQKFSAELAREWSIETGIIERLYTLDRGVTHTLIERGISALYIPHNASSMDSELVARTIQAHGDVLEGLFAFVRGERELSTSYIKELHAQLLRHQTEATVFDQFGNHFQTALIKGTWKTHPNSPRRADGSMHEYCPPEHVDSEMDRLIKLHHQHIEKAVPPQIESAWLHHAFTQIHPFQDGNGRVARALATVVFIRAGYLPLVVTRDDQEKYYDALESADAGDLTGLISMFARIQKRALTRGIGHAADQKPVASADEAIAVTRDLLVDLGTLPSVRFRPAIDTAGFLHAKAEQRIHLLFDKLTSEFAQTDQRFSFERQSDAVVGKDITSISSRLQYDADPGQWNHSTGLRFRFQSHSYEIWISFHGVGPSFRGVMIAVAFSKIEGAEPIPLGDEPFRIAYTEGKEQALPRFERGLEAVLIEGLARWRKTFVSAV